MEGCGWTLPWSSSSFSGNCWGHWKHGIFGPSSNYSSCDVVAVVAVVAVGEVVGYGSSKVESLLEIGLGCHESHDVDVVVEAAWESNFGGHRSFREGVVSPG